MRTIFVVSPEEADMARRIEKTLMALPIESGILFAGVRVPCQGLYELRVGCARNLDVDTACRLVLQVLEADQVLKLVLGQIDIKAYRGVVRSPQEVG
jgi:hypothetical protein